MSCTFYRRQSCVRAFSKAEVAASTRIIYGDEGMHLTLQIYDKIWLPKERAHDNGFDKKVDLKIRDKDVGELDAMLLLSIRIAMKEVISRDGRPLLQTKDDDQCELRFF